MSKICPTCGLGNDDEGAFCRGCGRDLRAIESRSGPPAGDMPPLGPYPPPPPGPRLSLPPPPDPLSPPDPPSPPDSLSPSDPPSPPSPSFPAPPALDYLSTPDGAPAYGFGDLPPSIPTHLVWAILSTILCCLPLGIVSIVYAAQVNTYLFRGDIPGAKRSSRLARNWAIASIVVSALGWIIYGTAVTIGGLGALGWLHS